MNSFKLIELYEILKENPEANVSDIAEITGKSIDVIKHRINRWGCYNYVTFDRNKGNYCNIEITPTGFDCRGLFVGYCWKKRERERLENELIEFKTAIYVDQVYYLKSIMENQNLKPVDRLKAIDLQQKALRYVNSNFAYKYMKERLGK